MGGQRILPLSPKGAMIFSEILEPEPDSPAWLFFHCIAGRSAKSAGQVFEPTGLIRERFPAPVVVMGRIVAHWIRADDFNDDRPREYASLRFQFSFHPKNAVCHKISGFRSDRLERPRYYRSFAAPCNTSCNCIQQGIIHVAQFPLVDQFIGHWRTPVLRNGSFPLTTFISIEHIFASDPRFPCLIVKENFLRSHNTKEAVPLKRTALQYRHYHIIIT